ncbi:MAG: response regulator [Candidatus Omnitrophica bacterium]|nr:response regulator [Candidatus Omnitrophota bacterium]
MISEEKILAAQILVIDDNILNIQILKKILSNAGFINITTTTDPTQAVSLYKQVKPDLILLDLNMPLVDGFAVMAQLSAFDPEDYLPVLVVTAEEESIRFKALKVGAKDFLHKPYDHLDVILRSRNIIEVRLLYSQIKNHNVSLEQQVSDRIRELKDTRLDVIRRLAVAAELRDAGTAKHIHRMSHYCQQLALAVGFSKAQAELVLTTSPLHDIGKIAIPDAILLKSSSLSAPEFEIMKTHTTLGAQMLSGSDSVFLNMAQTIAGSHHEKWDGRGYPHGIKGEEIPLVGRICAVADVFDALTSERPYKKAWTPDEAVAEINRLKGIHFDPKLVEAFSDIIKDIIAIYGLN